MVASFTQAEVMQATGATRLRTGPAARFTAVCTDSRQLVPGCLFVALKGERFDAHDFLDAVVQGGAAGVLVNSTFVPGPRFTEGAVSVFQVADTLHGLGRLARFHRDRFSIPLCAVTGSNGKTTTKELVGAILSTRGPALKTAGNLNNEIGVPLTLFNLEPSHVAAVIEMGMNHPGEIARLADIARPDAGLITIVQPAHLEGCGSIEGVASAKGELFRGLTSDATAVVNLDDFRVRGQAEGLVAKRLTYGRAPEAEVRLVESASRGFDGLSLRIAWQGREYSVALKLVGEHNALNATGAFALALALGYSPEECVRGLESAESHQRRLQIVHTAQGVTVLDDCYNANPASMGAALDTVRTLASKGRAVAVLGDMLELGEGEPEGHVGMGAHAASRVALLALFGPRMKQHALPQTVALGERVKHFEDVEALVAWLSPQLRADDVVLVKASRGMRLERVVAALTGAPASGGH